MFAFSVTLYYQYSANRSSSFLFPLLLNIAIFHFQTEWLWIFKGKGEGSSIRKVLLFWKVKSNSAEFVKHGFWIAVDIQSKTCWKTAGNAKTAKSALLPQNIRNQSSGNVKSENYYFKHKFAFFPGGQYHQDLLIYWTLSHDNDNHSYQQYKWWLCDDDDFPDYQCEWAESH